jgi:Na+-transporting methylmalonyl-CoA/oxaloacetate decarboxylase gamma subunit
MKETLHIVFLMLLILLRQIVGQVYEVQVDPETNQEVTRVEVRELHRHIGFRRVSDYSYLG